jgi:hypothetical protein
MVASDGHNNSAQFGDGTLRNRFNSREGE